MNVKYSVLCISLLLGGCMVGPDYQKPAMELPQTFKEGAQWQRAAANPKGRWTASGGWPIRTRC